MNPVWLAVLIEFATLSPIGITIAYVCGPQIFQDSLDPIVSRMICALIAVAVNVAIGAFAVWLIGVVAPTLDVSNVKVLRIKVLGADMLFGYLPYMLPLFYFSEQHIDVVGVLLGILLLYILAFLSRTVPSAPLLRLFGLRFYEAELSDKRTVVLLIIGDKLRPLEVESVANITDNCIYGISNGK